MQTTLTQEQNIETLEMKVKEEIINLLEITDLADDINIYLRKFRCDFELCNFGIFNITHSRGEVGYTASMYSNYIDDDTRDEDRIKYKKVTTVFLKLLDIETTQKVKNLLNEYRLQVVELDK